MVITAKYLADIYNPWVNFLEEGLVALSDKDLSTKCGWTQLQLFVIDECDQQCDKKLRAGRDDLFADVLDLYSSFKGHWLEIEHEINRLIPGAESVLNDKFRDQLLPGVFQRIINTCTVENGVGNLIRVYDRHRLRSGAYELINYLINLRQRINENAPIPLQPMLTHMIKAKSLPRLRPVRKINFTQQLKNYLDSLVYEDFAAREWELLRNGDFRLWLLDVWDRFLAKINIQMIAEFQWRCFQQFLNDALVKESISPEKDPAMITAGTGFGKTEAFLLPILFFSLINLTRKKSHRKNSPEAILLYPRIDLCNDQLERCLWYSYSLRTVLEESPETNKLLDNLIDYPFRIAIAHGGLSRTENSALPFSVECPFCKSEGTDGRIILRVEQGWRGGKIVPRCNRNPDIHDIHSLLALRLDANTRDFTIAITTVDTLHRRLMDVHGTDSLWHNKKVRPRFIVLDELHIYSGQQGTHVANLCRRIKAFLKYLPPSGENDIILNPMPPIMIGVSATIGNPAEVCSQFFGVNKKRVDKRIFAPCASESIPMGHEYIILLKTPPHRAISITEMEEDSASTRFVSEQATFLQGVMALWHSMIKTSDKYRMLAFVDSIDSVWRISKNLHDAEVNRNLYAYRLPSGRSNVPNDLMGGNFCPLFHTGKCLSPPHQYYQPCNVYNQGECWWTMSSSSLEFLRPMRVLANSSGQRKNPAQSREGSLNEWDCLLTTSTLEVGFDHPQLIATAQFKAPPNPASFQQRKGRGGRGIQDIPITLVVLGNSPGDLFAFRNENRFFAPSAEELAIRIDAKNPYVRSQHILSAIFDYLSWRGITQNSPDIHKKCDIPTALQRIDETHFQKDLLRWIINMYSCDGLSEAKCRALLSEAIQHMREAVVTLSSTMTSKGLHTSLDLFRRSQIPPSWLFEVQEKVKQGKGGEMEQKTLLLLEAADSFSKSRYISVKTQETFLHPPEYFSNLPINNRGRKIDGSETIPAGFVPVPIGGNINVKLEDGNREEIVKEPRIQVLASFLPGGFKNRWNFKLWYGEWKEVRSHPSFADISDICRSAHQHGSLKTFLAGRPIPSSLINAGENSKLVEPLEIKVYAGKKYFRLNAAEDKVALDHPASGPVLSRDPTSSIQTLDLLENKDISDDLKLAVSGNSIGIRNASYGSLTIMRLFYANIVTAYLREGNSRGMIVRFWDSDQGEPAIPVARLSSQGIKINGTIKKSDIDLMKNKLSMSKMIGEHYWRNVYKLIWRHLLLGNGIQGKRLPNSFACASLLQALKFIDYRAKSIGLGEIINLSSQVAQQIALESAKLCSKIDINLLQEQVIEMCFLEIWDAVVSEILIPADDMLANEMLESYAMSIGRALAREIALETNSNIDMIEVSIEVTAREQDFILTITVYDQLQGGSGTVLSFVESTARNLQIEKILKDHCSCQTHTAEREILSLLQDTKYNADLLFAAINSDSPGDNVTSLSAEARLKVKRLLASPEITSFYQGVVEIYIYLKKLLRRAPTSPEIAISLLDRPMADPRGNALVQRFSSIRGGIAELIPRVEEILPICIGACPDCLGDSRLSVEQGDIPIPDRFLLGEEDKA